jgi:hypothetical protein
MQFSIRETVAGIWEMKFFQIWAEEAELNKDYVFRHGLKLAATWKDSPVYNDLQTLLEQKVADEIRIKFTVHQKGDNAPVALSIEPADSNPLPAVFTSACKELFEKHSLSESSLSEDECVLVVK